MKISKKAIIFLIMIIAVFTIPMIYLDLPWGYTFGWVWGFYDNPIETSDSPRFVWIWQALQGLVVIDQMYIVEILAFIGVIASLALMLLAIIMNSNKRLVITVSSSLLGFVVVVIIGMALYNASPEAISSVNTPLGIFVAVCSGIAIVQEIVVSRRRGES
ncbi:MAG: hypothetical protein ACFFCS_22875 [Candidatus Hodarchaeota archaeon]